MNKTPSVFLRNPENMSELLDEPNPLAQWVFDGEGVATRKYDGTCVMLDADGHWWARREVKKDKTPPPNWIPVEVDDITGKRMGWEPVEQSGIIKHFQEALANAEAECAAKGWTINPGTYELCGPKINGNPENYPEHCLISHAEAERIEVGAWAQDKSRDPEVIKELLKKTIPYLGWEGVVWHHPDGRMAKLKISDFGIKRNG